MATRHVLVGSGPASMAAAETIRGLDHSAEVTILGAERYGYYSRPGLAYYLANEVPERGLFPYTEQDLSLLGVRIANERVTRIDPANRRVTLESGGVLPYDRLLLATGSWAIPLQVPGAELDGVVKLDDMHDARDLIARAKTAKSAVVVGGGITALEIVEGLCAHRVEVHYFMRKDRYWGNVLSESESRIVEQGLADRGVKIHHFTEIARVIGRDGRVAAAETTDGTQVPCDLLAVAIGVLPQKQLAEAAGIACGRGVLVDDYLRSSAEDVFAAGDVAEVREPATAKGVVEVLWNTAVRKGRIAGENMASGPARTYRPDAPLNVTRLAGSKITIIGHVGTGEDSDVHGIMRGDSEQWRSKSAPMVEAELRDAHIRIVFDQRAIVGALVMGDQALSFPLQEMIVAHADTSSIVDDLAAPGAPIDAIVRNFHRDWRRHRA
jgi:NAD(P)H-nitrite reductase large subunit